MPLLADGPPQLQDSVRAFLDAEPLAGEHEGALLLCRVDVVGERGWDTFGAVDLLVTLTVGGAAPVAEWGPEDRSSAVVSVPGVRLHPGTSLGVVVEDRDVTGTELIARGRGTYTKTPLRLDLDDVQVECRAMTRAAALVRAESVLTRVATTVEALAAADAALHVRGLGRPDVITAALAVDEAAAWVGAADPAVVHARQGLAKAKADFDERARAAIAAHAAATTVDVTRLSLGDGVLVAKVVTTPRLALELSVPSDAEPVTFRAFDITYESALLFARGSVVERDLSVDEPFAQIELQPGQRTLQPLATPSGAPTPALVRVRDVLLRVPDARAPR